MVIFHSYVSLPEGSWCPWTNQFFKVPKKVSWATEIVRSQRHQWVFKVTVGLALPRLRCYQHRLDDWSQLDDWSHILHILGKTMKNQLVVDTYSKDGRLVNIYRDGRAFFFVCHSLSTRVKSGDVCLFSGDFKFWTCHRFSSRLICGIWSWIILNHLTGGPICDDHQAPTMQFHVADLLTSSKSLLHLLTSSLLQSTLRYFALLKLYSARDFAT